MRDAMPGLRIEYGHDFKLTDDNPTASSFELTIIPSAKYGVPIAYHAEFNFISTQLIA